MASRDKKPFPHESYDEAYYQLIARQEDENWLSHRLRMRLLDEILDVGPGDRVLDMGSGAGVVSRHLARRGARVEAVDLAPAAVAVARRRCQGLPVRFTVCDAARCDHLEPASFDKATCCDLIEHVHDGTMMGLLREAHRLLKPGGRLFVYSPNRRHWMERLKAHGLLLKNPVQHIAVRTIDRVRRALVEAGFEIDHVSRTPSMLPVVRWLERAWIALGVSPELAIYRVCILARKPGPGAGQTR